MAGTKRPGALDESGASNTKRRKVIHQLRHQQPSEAGVLPAPQDRAFYGAQLLRSISLALVAVGFDSVHPTALESFRADVEEYMLHFLSIVRTSMLSGRRQQPLPQDFLFALAKLGISESSLEDQLKTGIPPSVALPPIGAPPPDEERPRDLEDVLSATSADRNPKAERPWIPAGFPAFPGENTYKSTAVYTTRETDPRQIREKATEEGMLAEQALRELMAAAKEGKQQKEAKAKKRNSKRQKGQELWESAMSSIYQQDEDFKRKAAPVRYDFDFGGNDKVNGETEERTITKEPTSEGPLLVNYDRRFWRKASETAF